MWKGLKGKVYNFCIKWNCNLFLWIELESTILAQPHGMSLGQGYLCTIQKQRLFILGILFGASRGAEMAHTRLTFKITCKTSWINNTSQLIIIMFYNNIKFEIYLHIVFYSALWLCKILNCWIASFMSRNLNWSKIEMWGKNILIYLSIMN